MTLKRFLSQIGLLYLCLLGILPAKADSENPFGQTLQINTHLNSLAGKPVWLLMLRNVETGQVLPYTFPLQNFDNFWIALTWGHNYQITVSTLQFEGHKSIENFCHLQTGLVKARSFVINVSGDIIPNRQKYHCQVMKFKEYNFPMANLQD
jgi:hypothetical protein